MVKEYLTPEMINVGENLLKALDASGLQITAAMWLFDPESNYWQLKFSAPVSSVIGYREVYRKIGVVRNSIGLTSDDFPLDTVGLLDSRDEILGLLQQAVKTGPGISRIRFSRNAIKGRYIDDALIYRINQPAAPSPNS